LGKEEEKKQWKIRENKRKSLLLLYGAPGGSNEKKKSITSGRDFLLFLPPFIYVDVLQFLRAEKSAIFWLSKKQKQKQKERAEYV
jgi:hypothetical protein